jgi:hypothetical protein
MCRFRWDIVLSAARACRLRLHVFCLRKVLMPLALSPSTCWQAPTACCHRLIVPRMVGRVTKRTTAAGFGRLRCRQRRMSMEELAVRYRSSQRMRRSAVDQGLQVLATRNSTPMAPLPLVSWSATCAIACPLLRVCNTLVVMPDIWCISL